jgi:hypothetical protein
MAHYLNFAKILFAFLLVLLFGAITYIFSFFPQYTLAMLNIEPPEPKNSGSNADDPINLAHLLGMLHIVDLIC